MLRNIAHATKLSKKYNISTEDIILIALNCSGLNANIPQNRIRFKFKLDAYPDQFYLALCVNTTPTPFSLKDSSLFLNNEKVGTAMNIENDTCDSTYFRRNKTTLTLNSNSRSHCRGCKFCGTYNQDANDTNNLLTKDALINRINYVLKENNMRDLSHFIRVTICTACFNSEEKTVNHILMVRDVLSRQFRFNGILRYIGSEIVSEKSFNTIKEEASPFALSLTLEIFTRRKKLLRKNKSKVSLDKARWILSKSIKSGFDTNILYILGLDPLKIVIRKFKKLAPLMNKFPIINLFQNYLPEHELLRNPEARTIEYYLEARKELEKIFESTSLRPESWEDYRPLWYLTFKNEKLNSIRI